MDKKNDEHVPKVLKKSFECMKVLSARAKEIKAAKSGSYKIVAAYGDAKPCRAQLHIGFAVDLHVSNACVRAKICTELKSVSKSEKIQHCYENW
jgi:hypothetical protein